MTITMALQTIMPVCKENFEYVNSVKLKTNGEESVSYTWEGFRDFMKTKPLVAPKIYVSICA